MITFCIALLLLFLGYRFYGAFVNRIFSPDAEREVPAHAKADGVDYIVMPNWKVFMIQFLNIAGLGPIYGAIMGAQFGTSSYLWIVFGCIFAGAVHDFFAGGLSVRNGGAGLPDIVGKFLGKKTQKVMAVFTLYLMVLVGAVFVSGPAELLGNMTGEYGLNFYFWLVVIFVYYILATLCPVDKIIGRLYPLFAFALLFMAVGLLVCLFVKWPGQDCMPEMWTGFGRKFDPSPIFPMLFISIACGAISGFHATQSPLMARCMDNEKLCRPIFYGAMITEGVVALIWAAVATYFFNEKGCVTHQVVDGDTVRQVADSGAYVAKTVAEQWLGHFGSILAIIGIVVAPISTGDTALRTARLILAEMFHIEQKSVNKRLFISIPLFIVTFAVLCYSLADANGFKLIWQYFAWSNQLLSVFTLWAITVCLTINKKPFWVSLLPALLMTCVCSTFVFVSPSALGVNPANPEGWGISVGVGYLLGGLVTLTSALIFARWYMHRK